MIHRRQRGIALVASLVVLVAVFAFGVGAVFLAQSNLGIASNQQAHLVAKSAAEAGMETVMVVLSAAGEIPNQLVLPTLPVANGPAVTYQVVRYVPSPTLIEVSIVGTAPRGARYQADAIIVPVVLSAAGPGTPFPIGLVSEDGVNAKKIESMINAHLHANNSLISTDSLDNAYQSCNELNQCTALTGENRPVSAAAGATCSLDSKSNLGVCSSGQIGSSYTQDPVTVGAPPIDTVIAEAFDRPLPTSATDALCGQVVNGRTLVCVTGGTGSTNTTIAAQSGTDIVVFGNARMRGTYRDVNLLTIGGNLFLDGTVVVERSTLISGGNITQQNELRAGLGTTIAARGTISLTGNIYSITASANDPNGVLFMSGGDFYSGNAIEKTTITGSDRERAAAFIWSGGTVTLDNKANLLGGIAAVGTIYMTSNDIAVNGSGAMIEGYFGADEILGFAFGSRR